MSRNSRLRLTVGSRSIKADSSGRAAIATEPFTPPKPPLVMAAGRSAADGDDGAGGALDPKPPPAGDEADAIAPAATGCSTCSG